MKLSSDTRRWLLRLTVQVGAFVVVGVGLIALLGLAQRTGWIATGNTPAAVSKAAATYTCPMHPKIRQNQPGDCPICGMALVPVASEWTAPTPHDHSVGGGTDEGRYICPMMCVPPSTEPGKCPVCAMDLVPASSGGSGDERSVTFDPASRRLAGIQTEPVTLVPLSETLRAVGEIAYDQSREATLSAYVDGRLERLYADSVGVRVSKGQKLVELYSPDLYSAQQEYLAAVKNASSGPLAGDSLTGELVGIARDKLVELGLTDSQIDALRSAGRPASRIAVAAPIGGTITHKPKNEGDYVRVGEPIYHIADLSVVWLRLELFPEQAARVREGQSVTAKVDSLPGRTFEGTVLLIEPTVDPKTRTVGVRVELPNPDGLLRPGDYATARIELPAVPDLSPSEDRPLLAVPADAVLQQGGDAVAYVETEPGRFEIRRVEVGPVVDGRIVILDGLAEGEAVATQGNFLIDSQMQLAGNLSLIDASKLNAVAEPGEPAFPDGPLPLDGTPTLLAGERGEQLDRIYAAYFAVRDRLASDQKPDVDDAMTLLTDAGQLAADESLPEVAQRHLAITSEAAARLFEEDLEAVRDGFRRVSHGLLPVASRIRGPATAETLTHFYCPMVEGGGGDWLQAGALDRDALRNPYWGSEMLTCGQKVRELTVVENPASTDGEARR